MTIHPEYEEFEQKHALNKPQLQWLKKEKGTHTPSSVAERLQKDEHPFFLLESVESGTNGQYSIIGIKPDLIWKADDTGAYISKNQQEFVKSEKDIITSCKELVRETQFEIPSELPPMASSLIGYLSYDSIRLREPVIPDENPANLSIPIGLFMRPSIMVIFDNKDDTIYITTPTRNSEETAQNAYQEGEKRLQDTWKEICKENVRPRTKEPLTTHTDFKPNMTKSSFLSMIEKAKEYILSGDIFQVVPSQRFERPFKTHPLLFYQKLRDLNPSPFMFYLDLVSFQLVGSSPEIMVRVKDETVTIRPLAGTRKRGKNAVEDQELAEDLLKDKKEISEHLMLVDLSRNDVGRVSQPSTVKVVEEMIIEYYSHVMHISSTVEGKLSPKYDAIDALFSGLPVGTVSGAPKIRAMQIIDELEPEKREFYAGCIGYFSANGNMETCITLRTALIKENTLYIQAGCGVVAESIPENEYQETLNKAAALFKAALDSEK